MMPKCVAPVIKFLSTEVPKTVVLARMLLLLKKVHLHYAVYNVYSVLDVWVIGLMSGAKRRSVLYSRCC